MGALKTIFLITLATTRMIFPGIPGASPAPGQTIDQVQIPAVRSLNFDLMTAKNAIKTAKAELQVPAGLGIGESVKLEIVRGGQGHEESEETATAHSPDFKILSYWGVGEAIPEGQPKQESEGKAEEVPVLPDYPTYAQWPGYGMGYEGKEITSEAHAPGLYTLSSFCGDTSVELGPEQDFLAPVELVNFNQQADLEKPITLQWKPVPNAVGYLLIVYGGNSKSNITWSSSSQPNPPVHIEYTPLKEAELKQYLETKVLLPADTTSATIPAGVFKGSDSVFMTIIAVGKDKIAEKNGIETQVLVRSTACVPLYSQANPWSKNR